VKIHIVQKGDTLWKIAKKYGVNFEELKQMNTQLSNPDMIMPGMKIKVPTGGGMVKKEAPITGKPEAKINMGTKKEMPKEQPIALAPKEAPKKEMPIEQPPKMEEQIEPIAEAPKKPFTPKMPQPIIPEIDINNYYMMNMANLSVQPQQPAKPVPKPPKPVKEEVKPKQIAPAELQSQAPPQFPMQPKQLPPETKPLPEVKPLQEMKPVKGVKPLPEAHTDVPNFTQGGGYEPMNPMYPQNFYPYPQATPGFGQQAGFAPQAPYPQVQGAMTGAPVMPTMPHGMMPGVPGMGMQPFDDESSSFMPQTPMMPNQVMGAQNAQMPMMPSQVMGAQDAQMPMMPNQVMGAQDAQMPMMPNQVMGAQDAQMPMMPSQVMGAQNAQMPLMPTEVAGVQDTPMYQAPMYPYPPYPAPLYPAGPVMPGPGYCPPGYPPMGMPQQMPYSPMPQVQGVMDQMESPNMGNYQMPLSPNQTLGANYPAPAVQGVQDDCGCGPTMTPYGAGSGFAPGMPPVYSPSYGQPMAQQPYMNPYGYGPSAYGMPRGQNTNDDGNDE
jgi:morphogenetic protein associated with SpoVID